MKSALCIVLVSVHLVSCTTLTAIPYSQQVNPLREGERIVVSVDGQPRGLVITSVDAERICGEGLCVGTDAIQSVERETFSFIKTAGLVLGIVLIAGLVAVSRMGPLFGGPPTFPGAV